MSRSPQPGGPRTRRVPRSLVALSTAVLLAFGTACSTFSPFDDLPGSGSADGGGDNGGGGLTVTADAPAIADTGPADTAAAVSPTQGSSPAPAGTGTGTGTGQTINPSNPTETLGFSLGSQSHQQDANNRSRRSITDVRSAGQDGFDRVVFELDGGSGQISWGASYQNPPMNAASDDPIPHPGDSALVVGVTGLESPYDSSYRDLTAVTVTPVDTSSVVQVQGDGWFEGATMFIISVDGGDRPFRVFSLDGPHRLVIDIQTS